VQPSALPHFPSFIQADASFPWQQLWDLSSAFALSFIRGQQAPGWLSALGFSDAILAPQAQLAFVVCSVEDWAGGWLALGGFWVAVWVQARTPNNRNIARNCFFI
jgi:hypothetical protein